jgi:hypothetical protein
MNSVEITIVAILGWASAIWFYIQYRIEKHYAKTMCMSLNNLKETLKESFALVEDYKLMVDDFIIRSK